MKKLASIVCLNILLVNVAIAENKTSTKISSGLFYSTGESQSLGSADSTQYSVPLMISITNQRFHANVSTSYIDVNNKYPATGTTVANQGMGDTTLSLSYDVTESPWLTVKLKYKFATGDKNKGLSTGKDDTSVQLDYFAPVSTRTSTFATLGYKFVGKVSGTQMQDSGYGSIGLGYIFPTKTSIGASLDYRQTTFKNLKDQTGASLFASQKLSPTWSLSGFGGYDNTQTTSLGITLTRKF